VRFSKMGKIRWTSHRDVARMWERAFRRIDLPLTYTAGFSPRPKVSFGLALPTGAESVAEYLDIELDPSRVDGLDVSALPPVLSAALPAGIDVLATALIDDKATSLQHEVTSCEWVVRAANADTARLRELVGKALAADHLVVTRERKGHEVTDDIRPAILSLTVVDEVDSTPAHLEAELATHPRALRPSELVAALDPTLEASRVRRISQWISRGDGAREEPLGADLPLDAFADAPPAPEMEPVG